VESVLTGSVQNVCFLAFPLASKFVVALLRSFNWEYLAQGTKSLTFLCFARSVNGADSFCNSRSICTIMSADFNAAVDVHRI
jgi:hypothetical protein